MSWFSDLFKSKKGGIREVSTLSPQQERLMKAYGEWLTSQVGKGATPWPGEFVAPLSEYEEAGLKRLGEYVRGEPPEILDLGIQQFGEALRGLSPEYMEEKYRELILPRQRRLFEEEVIPKIRESYVGPGTFYGTGRLEAERKSAEEFGESTASQLFDYIMRGQEYGREALRMLPSMVGLVEEEPLRRAEAGLELGALPRLLEQMEVEARLKEFIRTQPEYSPILQYMQPYLHEPTKAFYYERGKPSPFVQLLEGALPIVGSVLGQRGSVGS